jgi:diketogulonate reductase-like aldo/keto reductase
VIRQDGLTAIPRASSPEHVRENVRALDIQLTARDLEEIDRAFPPPRKKRSLEMI